MLFIFHAKLKRGVQKYVSIKQRQDFVIKMDESSCQMLFVFSLSLLFSLWLLLSQYSVEKRDPEMLSKLLIPEVKIHEFYRVTINEVWFESRFTGRWFLPMNALFNGRIPFLPLVDTGVKRPFFGINRLKLQKLLKSCWPSETENYLRLKKCWKSFVRIAAHSKSRLWNIAKSTRKSKFPLCAVFSIWSLLKVGHNTKREFCAFQ